MPTFSRTELNREIQTSAGFKRSRIMELKKREREGFKRSFSIIAAILPDKSWIKKTSFSRILCYPKNLINMKVY